MPEPIQNGYNARPERTYINVPSDSSSDSSFATTVMAQPEPNGNNNVERNNENIAPTNGPNGMIFVESLADHTLILQNLSDDMATHGDLNEVRYRNIRAHIERVEQEATDRIERVEQNIERVNQEANRLIQRVDIQANDRIELVDQAIRERMERLQQNSNNRMSHIEQQLKHHIARLEQESSARVTRLEQESTARMTRLEQDSNNRMDRLAQDSMNRIDGVSQDCKNRIDRVSQDSKNQHRHQALEQLRQRIQNAVAIENARVQSAGIMQRLIDLENGMRPGGARPASANDIHSRLTQEAMNMDNWKVRILNALQESHEGREMELLRPVRAALVKIRSGERLRGNHVGAGQPLNSQQVKFFLDKCFVWIEDTFGHLDSHGGLEGGQQNVQQNNQQVNQQPDQQPAQPHSQQTSLFIRDSATGGTWELPAANYDLTDLRSDTFLRRVAIGFVPNGPAIKRRASHSPGLAPTGPRPKSKIAKRGNIRARARAESLRAIKREDQQRGNGFSMPLAYQGPLGPAAAGPGSFQYPMAGAARGFGPPSTAMLGGLQLPRGAAVEQRSQGAAGNRGESAPAGRRLLSYWD